MTNADKYLKDGVENIESLIKDFFHFVGCVEDSNRYNNIYQFFLNEVKPTLTEDEKVILKSIKDDNWAIIGKTDFNELYLANYCKNCDVFVKEIFKKDLFQFIKPRRRI